jgi:hypothetical protein
LASTRAYVSGSGLVQVLASVRELELGLAME